jgi:hypothetical protein
MTNPLLAEINNLSPGAKAALASAHQAASQATTPPPLVPNSAPAQQPNAAVGPKALNPELWKAPAETPPPGLAPPNSGPMPAAIATPGPSEAPPSVMAPRGTIPADTAELARKESTGSGISQIHGMIENSSLGQAHPLLGKILGWGAQVPAMLGDIAGSAVAPQVTRLIPGTEYHHDDLVKQGERQVAGGVANAQKEAETGETQARTQELQNPADEVTPLTTDSGIYGLHKKGGNVTPLTDESGQQLQPVEKQPAQNVHVLPDGKVISVKTDPKTGKSAAEVVYEGDPTVKTEVKPLEINGKPHQVLINSATGEQIKDLGETGEKPPTINLNADKGRDFQEKERGRGLLDKAEQQFRTAQQGANTMRDMLAQADAGNKMSAQMLPLEGALQITTAQGVHRINRTEVDQFQGAGSLFDKIQGELGKVSAGQPIPPNIRNDIRKLVAAQEKQAYSTYKGAYDSAAKRYHLDDEAPLPEPGGEGPASGSSGKAVSLKAAMGLPVNKGKSEADVRRDIESHGHQVGP